jgi:1,4-dihydroxy-2-naphthoate octaprenyltransferase
MTINAAVLGGLLAMNDGFFSPGLWLLCLIGLALSHATNNLLNDYVDFESGVDRENYYRVQYGTHVLYDRLMTKAQLRRWIIVAGMLALFAGLLITLATSWHVLVLMALGGFFLLLYTSPLKRLGLGELAVYLVWGPLMIGGVDFVLRGAWHTPSVLSSCIFGLAPTLVVFGKHIDKLVADESKGVRTLPVRLGERRSRILVVAMLVGLYLGVIGLIYMQWISPVSSLVLLATPAGVRLLSSARSAKPETKPESYPDSIWPLWFSAYAFDFVRRFGFWLMVGLLPFDIVPGLF